MIRRLTRLSSLAGLWAFAIIAAAQSRGGLDVVELNPAVSTGDPARIVVTEFFSYQCPHCNSFEPVLRHWAEQLPDDVDFKRVPTSLGRPAWEPVARAYYALEAMGELKAVDAALFRAIHIEGQRLFDKDSIAQWLQSRGVDRTSFAAVYDSFGVNTSMNQAERSFNAHRILSIPALVIDGRYRVLIRDDGTYEQQLAAVGALIDAVRSDKGL